MQFKRKIIETIDQELTYGNKPLLVIGARQIGKTTTIINYLNQKQSKYLYINLDSDTQARNVFEKDLDINRITLELSLIYKETDFDTIFFDEIQECAKALTSLKYFQEQSQLKIICSGSGLGVTINHLGQSFPVGKVKIINMYPMSFIEFLDARGETALLDIISKANYTEAINHTAHKLLLEQFDLFLMVSGFPESVDSYIQTQSIKRSFEVISDINRGYQNDINKYANNTDALKIRNIYVNINGMLMNENQKFKFSQINKQGFKVLDTAFEWLNNSFLTYPVYKLSPNNLTLPFSLHKKDNEFKLLINETSILMENHDYQYLSLMRANDNIFKGVIYENYVGTVLARYTKQLFYYHHKTTEIDYLLNIDHKIVPIEVKSGKNNPSKSLKFFIEKHGIEFAVKVTRSNIYLQDNILNVPIYLLDEFCSKREEILNNIINK